MRSLDIYLCAWGRTVSLLYRSCRCPNSGYWTFSRYIHLPPWSIFLILIHFLDPPSLNISTNLPLPQVQTRIFSQTYNPDRLRTGNSVLRQRLRGPSVAAYYPRRVATFKDLQRAYKKMPGEDLETWDDYEEDRLEHLNLAKARGKGAPKKKRTKDG